MKYGNAIARGQEDQLGALGLVVNALVLWNTRYMDAAVTHLKAAGMEIKKDDLERLSPLGNKHFNVLGRYHFQHDRCRFTRRAATVARSRRSYGVWTDCLAYVSVPLLG